MNIVKPDCFLLPVCPRGQETKRIELIARTCYKSEDLISEGSDIKLVASLVNSKHYAMLEHVSVAFAMDINEYRKISFDIEVLEHIYLRKYYLRGTRGDRCIISGNLRAWLEFLLDAQDKNIMVNKAILSRLFEIPAVFGQIHTITGYKEDSCRSIDVMTMTPEEKIVHCDRTVKFICDRGISHEIVRHRPASFAQESTRYANYSKGKFGSEITVVDPLWPIDSLEYKLWKESCEFAEKMYLRLTQGSEDLGFKGISAQDARTVLPTSLKTEIYMTANYGEWKHFFDLRALEKTGKAHPQIKELALRTYLVMKEKEPSIFED